MSLYDESRSLEWESGAVLPQERLEALKILYESGIKTFASFEPCIDSDESLKLIEHTLKDNSVDHYKIGKINNYKSMDKGVDWKSYLAQALRLLRGSSKQIYIKKGLQAFKGDIELLDVEIDHDYYVVKA